MNKIYKSSLFVFAALFVALAFIFTTVNPVHATQGGNYGNYDSTLSSGDIVDFSTDTFTINNPNGYSGEWNFYPVPGTYGGWEGMTTITLLSTDGGQTYTMYFSLFGGHSSYESITDNVIDVRYLAMQENYPLITIINYYYLGEYADGPISLTYNDTPTFFSYNRYLQSYDYGYSDGELDGWTGGYNHGYDFGYDNGVIDGESAGYANGYAAGEIIGEHNGYNSGYDVGLGEGYTNGYAVGKTDGHAIGYNLGKVDGYDDGSAVMQNSSWIITLFSGFAALMSIEVLPNITIGLLLGIPLILGVLFFVLRVIK